MMTLTNYSDTTPVITSEYDALDRWKTVSTSVAKSDFTYSASTLLRDSGFSMGSALGSSLMTLVITTRIRCCGVALPVAVAMPRR